MKKLFIFGSAVTHNFNSYSDVDVVAEIDNENPVEKGEAIMKLWTDLENLFSRKVDLLTSPVRNPYLQKQIDSTKQLVYDRTGL